MSVARGTTPTFILTFGKDVDLSQAVSVYVTIKSGERTITKSLADGGLLVEEHSISVFLTQQECFKLRVGNAEIQANWLTPSRKRVASEKATYPITENLLNEVIS